MEGVDVAPAALGCASGTALSRHVSPLPFLPGGDEMRVKALHHLEEEGLVEFDLLFGGHLLVMGTDVQVTGTGASCRPDACRLFREFAPL